MSEDPELRRTCDYCGDLVALLYCRADSAKLCFLCDRKVHFPNQLFSRHTRALLCDACGDSPASVLCFSDDSVLCHNCDCQNHHLSHQRTPLQGFSGCPSVTQLLGIMGFGEKSLLSTKSQALSVLGDPSAHKNRKSECGRQKEEILSQLREMIKMEPDLVCGEVDAEPNLSTGFERQIEANTSPSYEAGMFCWHGESSDRTNQIVPSDTSLRDFGQVVSDKHPSFTIPGAQANFDNQGKPSNLSPTPKATPYELTSHERDSALLRYREKKKARRIDFEEYKKRIEEVKLLRMAGSAYAYGYAYEEVNCRKKGEDAIQCDRIYHVAHQSRLFPQ
ncbi:hypothetical protein Fmac_027993 [Flemingia macrophylla]|uniref:B box-type domain-containing protein n=1 Tax=Flemingia macrophylla TaxID=520843 RepID=A0ABD1LJA9_9FABA